MPAFKAKTHTHKTSDHVKHMFGTSSTHIYTISDTNNDQRL